jgi:hypothetical protein
MGYGDGCNTTLRLPIAKEKAIVGGHSKIMKILAIKGKAIIVRSILTIPGRRI